MRAVGLTVALLVALLAAGCVSYPCVPGPLVSARGIGPGTPAEGGAGPHELRVHVTDPTGAPIAGAGVVLYWGKHTPDDFRDEAARPEAGNASEEVQPGRTAGTPTSESALRLRTGPDGIAIANVPATRLVGLVAAAEGHTEEWIGYLATGGGNQSSSAAITLYPQVLRWTHTGTLSPGGASTGQVVAGNYLWYPVPLDLAGPRDDLYLKRIVSLTINVTWENEALAFGDLAAGAGRGGEHVFLHDGADNLAMGAHRESGSLPLGELLELGFHGAASLEAGVASDLGYLAPLGLEYTLEAVATFDRAEADQNNCLYVAGGGQGDGGLADGPGVSAPGAGLWAMGVVLACAALARRRAQ